MPTEIINHGKLRKIRYRAPTNGVVSLYLEASGNVSAYLIDEEDKDRIFEKPLPGIRFYDKTLIDKKNMNVPFEGHWYLVIRNKTEGPVAVHWEVYF
jgi:hypothetical protein